MTSLDPATDLQLVRLPNPRELPRSVLLASRQQEPRQRQSAPSAPAGPAPLAERVKRAREGLYGSRDEARERARAVRASMEASGRR